MDERDKTAGAGAVRTDAHDAESLFPDPGTVSRQTLPELPANSEHLESLSQALSRVGPSLRMKGEATDIAFRLEVGAEIRRERRRQGLSQQELATKAKVGQSMLSNIETANGAEGPTLKTLRKLADALDMRLTLLPDATRTNDKADLGEVEVVKPANTPKSRVRVSALGDEGVSFVKTLISPEDLKRIRAKIIEEGWLAKKASAAERPATPHVKREFHGACVWSIEPNAATMIPGDDLVVLVFQEAPAMRMHILEAKKTGTVRWADFATTWYAKPVELVGGGKNVVISNYGVGKSTVFSVHAEDLLKRAGG